MPNEFAHLTLANHNQLLLDTLIPKIEEFPDWVTVVAFYKALHVVEAVFVNDPNINHGIDHSNREHWLKKTNRYSKLYRHYRPLYAASIAARYLGDRYSTFTDYLSPEDVIGHLINHDLYQLESSALKFLKRPDNLTRVSKITWPVGGTIPMKKSKP